MKYVVRCYTDQHGTHEVDVSHLYRYAEWITLSEERWIEIIKDMYGPTVMWTNFIVDMGIFEKEENAVNHPSHYGGEDNPYEAIKIIEAHDLGFHLGNVVKYVLRAGKKGEMLQDLEKALWYLNRKIEKVKNE